MFEYTRNAEKKLSTRNGTVIVFPEKNNTAENLHKMIITYRSILLKVLIKQPNNVQLFVLLNRFLP